MRVLVVTTWYPDAEHPADAPFCRQHVQALTREHTVQVVHVRLGSREPARDEVDDGVRVHRRSLRPRDPASILAVARDLRAYARGADLVHTMAFSSALVQALALPGVPWVHTEHWNGVRDPAAEAGLWPRVAFLRHVLRLTDCATGVTSDLTRILARFTRPGGVHLVPCIVAAPSVVAPLPPGPALPAVATGALIDRKDPILAVQVLAECRRGGIDMDLTWIGAGPLEGAVRSEAERLGVADHLHLTGAVPLEEVLVHLARARMFFLPTRRENFFVSAAEAISSGRPVVVGATGGQDDYIDGHNGILVHTQDVAAYTEAVRRTWQGLEAGDYDPLALSEGLAGRFGPEAVAREFAVAYDQAERMFSRRPLRSRIRARRRRERPGR